MCVDKWWVFHEALLRLPQVSSYPATSYSRGIPSIIRVLEFECGTSSIPSPVCECDIALNLYCKSVQKILLSDRRLFGDKEANVETFLEKIGEYSSGIYLLSREPFEQHLFLHHYLMGKNN